MAQRVGAQQMEQPIGRSCTHQKHHVQIPKTKLPEKHSAKQWPSWKYQISKLTIQKRLPLLSMDYKML